MLAELIEVLDRQWQFVNSQVGVDFAAHLFDFIRFLQEEPRLYQALQDAEREDEASRQAFEQTEAGVIKGFAALLQDLVAASPDVREQPPPEPESKAYIGSFAQASRLVDIKQTKLDPGAAPDSDRNANRLLFLC